MDVHNPAPILSTSMSMETANAFFDYFKSLSPDQRNVIFPFIKDKLPHLIKDSYDFFLVFVYLDDDQQSQLLVNFKGVVPPIKNFSNFYDIFNALTPEKRIKLIKFFLDKGNIRLLTNGLLEVYLILLRFECTDRLVVLNTLNSCLLYTSDAADE